MCRITIENRDSYAIFLYGWEALYYTWFKDNVKIMCFVDDKLAGNFIDGKPVITIELKNLLRIYGIKNEI